MSAKISGLIWELDLPRDEKYLLLALSDHADHEGKNVYPSIGLLAWKTGYSERQVQRLMRSLGARGLLVKVGEPTGRGRTVNYRIELAGAKFQQPRKKGDMVSPFLAGKGDISHTERVTFRAQKGDIAVSPESKTEPKARTFPPKSPRIEILQGPKSAEGAGDFLTVIQRKLERAGFETKRELLVFDRGDGSVGRIDIVAKRGEELLAIECDRATPREKSLNKLTAYDATRRLVVLREPASEFRNFPNFEDSLIACPC